MKKALITGITGQDGSYLAELLLDKNYEVHGLTRRTSTHNTNERIKDIEKDLIIHVGDVSDTSGMFNLISNVMPDEVYNLAAQSHVGHSFDQPLYTSNVDALGVLNLLEGIRLIKPDTKFYQASTSELFGKVQAMPQDESTPFYPRSPYAVAKLYAYWLVKNYREAYNIFACNGILYNHESFRRHIEFVTRKITHNISLALLDQNHIIELGNLDSKRDWGHAKDYVNGMYLMLQQDNPDDYVLATNETHTIREFIEKACKLIGWSIDWSGSGTNEIGIIKETGRTLVKVNPKFFRPTEVDVLLGNPKKAETILGWKREISFDMLIEEMMEYDIGLSKY
jgi:GDPmannose 4,6-dehydratase